MVRRQLRVVKPEIRVVGIDDGKFTPHSNKQVRVVGVVFRGGYWLEGVMSTTITVDALDATSNISSMIVNSPYYKQLRVILLNGITFAGFNVVDIKELYEKTGVPVIAVTHKKPDLQKIRVALSNLPHSEVRWRGVLNAGELFDVRVRDAKTPLYFEVAGIPSELAKSVLKLTATRSVLPEALRVAHLVASGTSSI
ncbi:MAG: DUF99 family protein [Candidatus Bathyarchaeota archaeon]|nr:DUF99 family protein [Candidatus Bathyarchaeota archaeon]